jgi:pimeloyl-ACP methyl ester carboxylesterase
MTQPARACRHRHRHPLRRRSFRVGALILATAVLAALAVAGPAVASASCPPGARCGEVTVPLDRRTPELGTTQVGYVLVPHRDRGVPARGTVVPNPGGPGASAGSVRAAERQFAGLRDRYDLLLIDPPGVGRSTPLECQLPPDLAGLGPVALQDAIGTCGRSLGSLAGAYGSATVADDFDAVRASLGIDKLDLVGESYGSYLFAVYARRHPEHVGSLVLSGAYPIHFDTLDRDRAAALRRVLRTVCARSGGACRGATVLADLGTVARQLRAHPFTVRVGDTKVRVDEESLALIAYSGALSPQDIYGTLPLALHQAVKGDEGPLVELIATVKLAFDQLFEGGGEVSLALNSATACHDYPVAYNPSASIGERRREFRAALRRAGRSPFAPFSPLAWTRAVGDGGDICIAWPDVRLGERPDAGQNRPHVPTLVIDGELDTNTPLAAARRAADQFPGARFVAVPNVGHTPSSDTTGCADSLVARFIRTHALGDESCLSRIPPIKVATAGG